MDSSELKRSCKSLLGVLFPPGGQVDETKQACIILGRMKTNRRFVAHVNDKTS
jgi:hypothetical protein